MPGGICASTRIGSDQIPDLQGDFDIKCCGARRANLEIDYRLIRYRAELAGVYDTDITDSNGNKLDLEKEIDIESYQIHWRLAKFIGYHPVIGKIIVELQNSDVTKSESSSIGTFTKLDKNSTNHFPSKNYNNFFFKVRIPRLGKEFVNLEPLVNSAEIDSIPPLNSLYQLQKEVKFYNLKSEIKNGEPSEWMNITKCWVFMPDQKYIDIKVLSVDEVPSTKENFRHYSISAVFHNKSPFKRVRAYWFTLSENPKEHFYSPDHGFFRFWLKRKKKFKLNLFVINDIKQPIVKIGAALTSNPITNNPYRNNGAKSIAFDLNKKMAFLNKINS